MKVFLCPSRRDGLQRCTQGSGTDGDVGACGDYVAVACYPTDNLCWFDVTAPITETCGVLIGAERFDPSSDASPQLAKWRSRLTFASVTDGLSNTMMIGEKHLSWRGLGNVAEGDGCMYYYHLKIRVPSMVGNDKRMPLRMHFGRLRGRPKKRNKQFPREKRWRTTFRTTLDFGVWHTGVCLFVMADGAVKQIRTNADRAVLSTSRFETMVRLTVLTTIEHRIYKPQIS